MSMLMACHCHIMAQDKPENDTAAYSRYYVKTAENNTSIFSGKIEPAPRNGQSMYLRPKSSKDRYGSGDALKPIPSALTFGEGSLLYDGVFYDGLMLRFDFIRDAVSVLSPASNASILLEPSRFEGADFHGYHIIAHDGSENLQQGYYLELHGGEFRALKKERYYYDESLRQFTIRYLDWYIRMDGKYTKVSRSKSSILKVLKKHRRELDRYVRDNRIDVRNDMENAVVMLIAEYERLEQE